MPACKKPAVYLSTSQILTTLFALACLCAGGAAIEKVPIDDVSSAYLYILEAESFCRHRRVALFSDKPVYKNGETAHFTAYFYHLLSKQPLNHCQDNRSVTLSIYDSRDAFITSLSVEASTSGDASAVDFSWPVDAKLSGGAYRVTFDDGNIKDQISVFILRFENRAIALVGDWSSDTVRPGLLLKGRVTLRTLTTEASQLENAVLNYSFLDSTGFSLSRGQLPLGDGSFQINFAVPQLPDGLLVFQATLTADSYSADYKREFYVPKYDDVVIDFTLARGKIVTGLSNTFYFQAFADKQRIDSFPFANADLILKANNNESVVQQVSSDDDGRGSFDFLVTAQHISDKASLILRAKFSDTDSKDFIVADFGSVEVSPVQLQLSKLVFKSTDTLDITLKASSYVSRVHLVLQDKTKVLYKTTTSIGSATDSNAVSKAITINLWQLSGLNGGVYTVQLYGNEPPVPPKISPEPIPIPVPVPIPAPIPVPVAMRVAVQPAEDKAAAINNAVAAVNEKLIVAGADVLVDQPIIGKPIIVPEPEPVVNPFVDYQGQILQEADIFIKPDKIVGAQVKLDKTFYLPGQEIKGTIKINKTCNGCDRDPLASGLQAYVIVTDESAFLEIEKSRENPSLFTKVFLQKEVFSPTFQFKNSYRFIDYIFDSNNAASASDIAAADKRLELLLGNQSQRKFLFDPDHLQDYINNPWSTKYEALREFYNYLIPRLQSNTYRPIYEPIFFRRDDVKVIDPPVADNVANNAGNEAGPANEDAQPVPGKNVSPPNDQTDQTNNDAFTDAVFKQDTILYARLIGVTGDELAFSAKLPDRVTNFSVRVLLISGAGRYGAASASAKVRKPLNIVYDAPLSLYSDEGLSLPVTIENNQAVSTTVRFITPVTATLTVRAQRSASRALSLQPNALPLIITLNDANGVQLLQQKVSPTIIPAGLRGVAGIAGYVSTKRNADSKLVLHETLPTQLVLGGNKLTVCYQNNLVTLVLEVLKTFNRVPAGCFEQASMTTYPLIIAIRILQLLPQTPEVIALKAELIGKLRLGIDLLLTYETDDGGFEWFGVSPGQAALTAYGLEQFLEIQALNEPALAFDSGVIDRSRAFLLSQRNNAGGFLLRQGYDELGNPPQDVSDIFITLVLSSAPDFNTLFAPEYAYVRELYAKFKAGTITLDSYKLALAGLLFLNHGELSLATEIAQLLVSRQDAATGEVLQAVISLTRSTGASLAVETTALAMLLTLRLKNSDFNNFVDKALRFILSNLKGGYFYSTQATVLALRAIAEYLAAHQQAAVGNISFDIALTGRPTKQLKINAADSFASACLDLSADLRAIEASGAIVDVTVRPSADSLTDTDSQYLFAITLETYSYLPSSVTGSPLDATISIAKSGDTSVYSLALINKADNEQGMTVWTFNKPSCYDFNINDLESLRERHLIDFYEIRNANSQIVFYWRGLAAKQTKAFKFSLLKRYKPNECVERASEIYLYYGKDKSAIYRRA